MKKLLVLLAIMMLSFNISAQTHSQSFNSWLAAKNHGILGADPISYSQLYEEKAAWLKTVPPGDFLIRARKNILTGLTVQTVGATTYLLMVTNESPSSGMIKAANIFLIGTSATGLILEIKGIYQIGQAGLLLNENGVGIKVPIK